MPSDKILKQKQAAVKALAEDIKGAESVVFSEYQGLTVEQDTAMRKAFREEGLDYRVVKNTALLRAFEALGIDNLEDVLVGPTAVAWSKEDITAAPRMLKKFVDEYKIIKIKGGVIDGAKAELETITALSEIPSVEVLYGKLVSSLLFPITSLAMTLNAIAKKGEETGKEQVADLVEAKAAEEPAAEATEEAKPEEKPEETSEAAPEAASENSAEGGAEEAKEASEE